MHVLPGVMKRSFLNGTGICLLILLNMTSVQIVYAQDKVAYVDEARLRQEYKQLGAYQEKFVERLQMADMDYTRKSREIDSLYQEKVYASGQSTLSSVTSDHERARKKMLQEHMEYLDELRALYAGQVAQCEAQIQKAIESEVKEAGYDKWAPLEGEKGGEDSADITVRVLLRLNQ